MRAHLLALVIVGSVSVGLLGEARAQVTRQGNDQTLAGRLDLFGRNLLGVKPRQPQLAPQTDGVGTNGTAATTSDAGTARSPNSRAVTASDSRFSDGTPTLAAPRTAPSAGSSAASESPLAEDDSRPAAVPNSLGGPGSMRLYERLTVLREPAFPDSAATAAPAADSAMPADERKQVIDVERSFETPRAQVAPTHPAYARRFGRAPMETFSGDGTLSQPPIAQPATAGGLPAKSRPLGQPTLAPSRESGQATAEAGPAEASGSPDRTPAGNAAERAGSSSAERAGGPSVGEAAADDAHAPLVSQQGPNLDVRTIGPRRITVGRESTYEVVLRNGGKAAADKVVVTVDLPAWADVAATEPSYGTAQAEASALPDRRLLWKIARLEARAEEKLSIRIVPRESKPIDLAVRWTYAPPASQAMIEVQEPKLQMRLEGPRQVLYGQKQLYRLALLNTGTGTAEGVEISLLPLAGANREPVTHRLGTLPAGDKKVVEVELTARQAGTLTIQVDARAEGGIQAHLSEQVMVSRAVLRVEVEAPPVQFVGAQAAYQVRVANAGNAPAKNVQITATLPAGAKFGSATPEGQVSSAGNQVTWTLPSLAAAAQEKFSVTCSLDRSGSCRATALASAEGDLSATAEALTQVEAVADLRLDVADPVGPVAVGDEAVYRIDVRNRGTKSANDVDVVVYFSEGIEPVRAEGGPHKLAPGQVVFDRIASVGAGKVVTLKVFAKAAVAGNHVFRAEVFSKPLNVRLASESTTRFYRGGDTAGTSFHTDPPAASAQPDATSAATAPERRSGSRLPSTPSTSAPSAAGIPRPLPGLSLPTIPSTPGMATVEKPAHTADRRSSASPKPAAAGVLK